jgi:methylglutaconyl-CoA hydratase
MEMIKYFEDDFTGILTLNRPEKRNALHPIMVKEVIDQLDIIEKKKKIRFLIITGEGKSFCAGADLAYLNDLRNYSSKDNERDSEILAELFLKIYDFAKPTIASVNGAAIAGGCGLAGVCDFIIADRNHSKFGYSEVKIGFIPAIVSIFLIKKIGEGKAKKLLLTGEIIDGKRAFDIGLVDILTDDVLVESKNLANQLAQNSDYSMKTTKKMIQSISNLNVKQALDYCVKLNTISRSTIDFQNGLNNFLKK